jgi:hypothetical protein
MTFRRLRRVTGGPFVRPVTGWTLNRKRIHRLRAGRAGASGIEDELKAPRAAIARRVQRLLSGFGNIGDIVGVLKSWEAAQARRSIREEGHGMV